MKEAASMYCQKHLNNWIGYSSTALHPTYVLLLKHSDTCVLSTIITSS